MSLIQQNWYISAVFFCSPFRGGGEGRSPGREPWRSIAAQHGHGEVVALLLAAGASVRATNRDGETALYAAAERGHARAVWLLLAARATP